MRNVWSFLFQTAREFSDDNAPVFGAALAYYTMFSLAPLIIFAVALAGAVFGPEAARGEVADQLQYLLGVHGAETVENLLTRAQDSDAGITASSLGVLTLLLGASRVFVNLQTALNVMWNVTSPELKGFRANARKMAEKRAMSFAMVLAVGFLLLVSLLASALLSAAGRFLTGSAPVATEMTILRALDFVVSFGGVTLLLALVYKFLPDTDIDWRDVWFGALATAVMFGAGKYLIGWYLGNSSFGSVFGAAGSLVVILVWIYYSAQIILFGAEMTQVFAKRFGSKRIAAGPEDGGRERDSGTREGVPSASA